MAALSLTGTTPKSMATVVTPLRMLVTSDTLTSVTRERLLVTERTAVVFPAPTGPTMITLWRLVIAKGAPASPRDGDLADGAPPDGDIPRVTGGPCRAAHAMVPRTARV